MYKTIKALLIFPFVFVSFASSAETASSALKKVDVPQELQNDYSGRMFWPNYTIQLLSYEPMNSPGSLIQGTLFLDWIKPGDLVGRISISSHRSKVGPIPLPRWAGYSLGYTMNVIDIPMHVYRRCMFVVDIPIDEEILVPEGNEFSSIRDSMPRVRKIVVTLKETKHDCSGQEAVTCFYDRADQLISVPGNVAKI